MIKIRNATREDIPTIVKFQLKMAMETESLQLDKETLKNGVSRVFDKPKKGFYLIAEENGKSLGSMMITPEWSDWRNTTWLWIQSLYITPENRKRGVFAMLYHFVQDMVDNSEKYAGIKLYVDRENKNAQKAYEKMGMERSHYRLFEWEK
jgi:L-amino acid N-acyltransferase YncA